MLSILEMILLFVVALFCFTFLLETVEDFLQKRKTFILFLIGASFELTMLLAIFAEFIKN